MAKPILAVTLRGPTVPQPLGQPIPIEIEVRNLSRKSLWLVGVLDGSEEKIRYPHYLPQIVRAGQVVARPHPPEDPLVGPLRLADFVQLAPNAHFDPTQRTAEANYLPLSTFSTFYPTIPGRYEYSLILVTESQQPEQWLGRFGQDAAHNAEPAKVVERLALVPRLTVTSNTLVIEVIAN